MRAESTMFGSGTVQISIDPIDYASAIPHNFNRMQIFCVRFFLLIPTTWEGEIGKEL